MHLYLLKIDDDKLVAALRAARRLPSEAWQLISALLGETSWEPGNDLDFADFVPVQPDDPAAAGREFSVEHAAGTPAGGA